MSVSYGDSSSGYSPPRRASMEWINEAWRLFSAQAGTWIVSCLVAILLPVVIYFIFSAVMGAGMMGLAAGLSSQNSAGGLTSGVSTGVLVFVGLFWMAYGLLYMPFILSGVYHMAVKQVRGELIGIADIFSGGPFTLRMLGYQIVYGLLIFALMLVLAIPLSLLHFVSWAAFASHPTSSNMGAVVGSAMAGFLAWYVLLLVCSLIVAAVLLPAHALIADGEGVFPAINRSITAMKSQALPVAGLLIVFGLLYMVSAIPCGLGIFVTIPMFWLLSALAYRDIIGMPGLGAPASPYGQPPAPGYTPGVWPPPPGQQPSFGQPPLFGQPPAGSPPVNPPPANPPRRSLSGDDLDGGSAPPPTGAPPQ